MENTVRAGGARLRRRIAVMAGIAAMIASVLAGAPAQAGPALVVDDDGAQCARAAYATIGAAVDAAGDGDTITVCPGRYAEQLEITKAVRIVGPIEAAQGFDCFASVPAQPGDLDLTRFAVLEPPPPATIEATEPVLSLAADGVEVAGLVIQGVQDQTPAPGNLFVPAVAASDAYSGYRIHSNVFRSNTLSLEFGSSGEASSRLERNCFRENRYGVANQRFALQNALVSSNAAYRVATIAFEIGWSAKAARDVVVRDNVLREATYGMLIENSRDVRVVGNQVRSVVNRGIWVSAGNDGVSVSGNHIEGGVLLSGNPAGIAVTGPTAGLPRSSGVVVRDNTVSGIRVLTATGGAFGFGIVLAANALDGGLIADNVTSGNGQGGITLFNNNVDNIVRDNRSHDNSGYGIRVQLTTAVGNLLRDNEMHGNGIADASDTTDPNPADGIQLLNTWLDNSCITDDPAGAICGVP